MNKPYVIYHRADFDGIFSREIARLFLGEKAEYIGWDYGDALPVVPEDCELYMIDISVEGLMEHPNLVWIDHHASAIAKFSTKIKGYRIDGVAACRLAWQWFFTYNKHRNPFADDHCGLPEKQDYIDRKVSEPLAVRLAGEYDVWDKRDPNAELFQHGLKSEEIDYRLLLSAGEEKYIDSLLRNGRVLAYAKQEENASISTQQSFTLQWAGLTFIACNAARYNSLLFSAALKPEHDACLGFCWDGGKGKWKVGLYGRPGRPEVDLSKIAVANGGGGHKQACGFVCDILPFSFLE